MMYRGVLFSLCLATSVGAQDLPAPDPAPPEDDGFSLMEEGARLLFRGLMSEMEPAIDEMGKALSEMEPALKDLMALMDDIRNYDAPRVLDNGDILIPRRPDAPPPRLLKPDPALPPPSGEIEL